MRYMEAGVLAQVTMEARSTSEIVKAYWGLDREPTSQERTHIYILLAELEEDGIIESKKLYVLKSNHEVRYWALKGGKFPTEHGRILIDRIQDALKGGPKTTKELFDEVYLPEEKQDKSMALKRLWRALDRARDRGQVRTARIPNSPGKKVLWEWIA